MDYQTGSVLPGALGLIMLEDLHLDNIADLDRDKINEIIRDNNIQSKEELERYLYHMEHDSFK